MANRIEAVPTNIITGFLGVGKTSAILHLLKSKPDNERWAVLVNEFGEIGVDGSLFKVSTLKTAMFLFERFQVVACAVPQAYQCKLPLINYLHVLNQTVY